MDKKGIKKQESGSKASTTYRNPFINFLQDFRKKNIGLRNPEVMQRGGEVWRKMSDNEKAPYYDMAKRAKRRRKRGGARRRRHRRRAISTDKSDTMSDVSRNGSHSSKSSR